MQKNLPEVKKIIDKHHALKSALISILQDIQAEFNYLPEEALLSVSESLNIPLIDICGVATFFKAFSLEPRGKHIITVCVGTACHVRGAQRILEQLERRLKIQAGKTTPDTMFTLEKVNCLGACALGPIVVADDNYHGQMTIKKADSLVSNLEKQESEVEH